MAVQSITGTDAIPQGALATSRVYNEEAVETREDRVMEKAVEENKGANIDTTA